ncbi:unnamed protein product [Rotaria sp. Silwood2]|nr:unnamed protein product [Rotaria sp. Silwood2]CAF4161471.1 unnamed protein product [Rotaria sp. Silwood2]CAF4278140.1 unnamed protein product [Rotaria sp. Silwood2]CAF4421655.1 unnamed protein product [Rotaria sp. Silwood2]
MLQIQFINKKLERCQINVSSKEEEYQTRKRTVRRKRIDSSLSNVKKPDANFHRVVLLKSSKEYIDVLNRFDSTMKNNYFEILKIERIQNERWYKQYAVHHDGFTQRYTPPDGRLLFHDCSSTSADKIAQECFNQTFAGLNGKINFSLNMKGSVRILFVGTIYGKGVYFHEHARYSNKYAKPNASKERTIFLARI